jgi:hypothetical protein
MKKTYTRTITIIKGGVEVSTGISPITTINGDQFVLVHYIDGKENSFVGLYKEEPTYDELKEVHNNFVRVIYEDTSNGVIR